MRFFSVFTRTWKVDKMALYKMVMRMYPFMLSGMILNRLDRFNLKRDGSRSNLPHLTSPSYTAHTGAQHRLSSGQRSDLRSFALLISYPAWLRKLFKRNIREILAGEVVP